MPLVPPFHVPSCFTERDGEKQHLAVCSWTCLRNVGKLPWATSAVGDVLSLHKGWSTVFLPCSFSIIPSFLYRQAWLRVLDVRHFIIIFLTSNKHNKQKSNSFELFKVVCFHMIYLSFLFVVLIVKHNTDM